MRRLWCRLRGHRWEWHHSYTWQAHRVMAVDWCRRCGDARVTPDGEAAALWRERRFDEPV